jgi:hypothetical protein
MGDSLALEHPNINCNEAAVKIIIAVIATNSYLLYSSLVTIMKSVKVI